MHEKQYGLFSSPVASGRRQNNVSTMYIKRLDVILTAGKKR